MINTDRRRKNDWPVSRASTAVVTAADSEDEQSPSVDPMSMSAIRIARIVQGHVVDDDYEVPQDDVSIDGTPENDIMRSSIFSLSSNHDHALGGTIDATASDDEDEQVDSEKMITLVGDVRDRTVIIVDDMIDRPGSFIAAAEHCRKNCGAKKVYVIATHGVFGDDCLEEMEKSWYIDHVSLLYKFILILLQLMIQIC